MLLKIITMLIASFLLTGVTYGYEVKEVEVHDDKTMEVSLDEGVQLAQWDITWDIKVLEDISISLSSKDFDELDKVVLTLDNDLKINSSYSLLSIFWADWSIDFEIWDDLLGLELTNPEKINISEQWILKVKVVDSKTVEVYFNEDLEWDEFEFKLLKEVTIEWLSSLWENKVIIKSIDTLTASTDYMLVIVSVSDTTWLELDFDEDIFDFYSGDDLVITDIPDESWDIDNLNAAGDEVAIEDNENFINNVAANVSETPDTGAETWILILWTLLINTFYYFSRRKIVKS